MVEKRYLPGGVPGAAKHYPPNIRKTERIAKQKDLSSLFNNNQLLKKKCGPIVVNIMPSDNWGLAILIRKKIEPAVVRNRIKRKIREVYRRTKPRLRKPLKVIFTIYGRPSEKDFLCVSEALLST